MLFVRDKEYAKKMLSSLKNAKDPTKDLKGYWNSYHEIDARKSSGLINKYVKELYSRKFV